MAFRIQHAETGLFWGVDPNDYITLGDISQSSVYDTSCTDHIKNVQTGKCLCKNKHHLAEREHDGNYTDFNFSINTSTGEIFNYAQNFDIIYDNGSVAISRSAPTRWTVVPFEAETDDVPVSRSAALIEEALNAADEEVPDLVSDDEEPEVAPEEEN